MALFINSYEKRVKNFSLSSKIDITGINNEPWHYRYVGKEAAQAMYDQDLCLEEYIAQLEQ